MTHTDLLVITSYPQQGSIHGEGTVGVASYTKNTLMAMRTQSKDLKITILAEELQNTSNAYQEDGIDVQRIWKRNSISSYFTLLKAISRYKTTKAILFEFELAMFGGYLSLLVLPVFLFFLRLMGKKVSIVLHQVVDDINTMAGHIGMKENSIKSIAINIGLSVFYRFLLTSVTQCVVFEQYLADKLYAFTKKEKVIVIPHAVEEFKNIPTKRDARKKLGIGEDEFVILYFGFIAWYKGTDVIVNEVRSQESGVRGKKVKLIIAGGGNPNHMDKPHYREYVEKIEQQAQESGGQIVVTGFVPEKDIPLYFASCDIVSLPYRAFMSSSGPLSLAFSFQKPVSMSEALLPYSQTQDVQEALQKTGATPYTDVFAANIAKLTTFSTELLHARSWHNIGTLYLQMLGVLR